MLCKDTTSNQLLQESGLKIWCVLQLVAAGQKTCYYLANAMLLRYNSHAIGCYSPCYCELLPLRFLFLIIEKIFTSATTTIFARTFDDG
jgi:hypothetical protein